MARDMAWHGIRTFIKKFCFLQRVTIIVSFFYAKLLVITAQKTTIFNEAKSFDS